MLFGTIYGCGTFRSKGNNTMKISKSQLRELIKEELEASMEEGMFSGIGAKIAKISRVS
jgi:endonuclease III